MIRHFAHISHNGPTRYGDEARCRKVLVSRAPVQSHLRDSNPGLQLYESCALPTELRWLVSIRLLPATVLNQTRVPLGGSGTLPVELRRRHRSNFLTWHRSNFLTYRRGAKGVKVDQPEWNAWPSMETSRRLPWTQGDGTLVDVKVTVDIAVHGEMLAGHGAACGREGSGQVRVSGDF